MRPNGDRRAAAGGTGSAADFLPARRTLPALRAAAVECRGCRLYANATQTVFGEGRAGARLMLVGEQPGDREDIEGHPFVGPAGRLLDGALHAAGIARRDVYLTNVVKHFKWEPRGGKSTRRIHRKPNDSEIAACYPWLSEEIAVVRPRVIVCLGATAAQALLGKDFRVTLDRGIPLVSPLADAVVATVHPSAVLRAPDDEARRRSRDEFVHDLEVAAAFADALERVGRTG
ncbi:MAG TPA: UdgX family uracil-DNA binding protein [Gemmatimonadaceae bacterium]|nr:UdgX family uracil-DNA binding protein [Gemmatimonadaceae bacterium]